MVLAAKAQVAAAPRAARRGARAPRARANVVARAAKQEKMSFMAWLNDAFVKDSRDWAGYETDLKNGQMEAKGAAKKAEKPAKKNGGLFGR